MQLQILNATEHRIRTAGYHGFSFREIAKDVGIKSSSVHHYFPTKESLGVAVARRYTDRFFENLAQASDQPQIVLRKAFLKAMESDGLICLCGSLASGSTSLPPAVALETKRFFEEGIRFLTRGIEQPSAASKTWAMQILATLEGAMIVAISLGEVAAFTRATQHLPDPPQHSTPTTRPRGLALVSPPRPVSPGR